MVIGFQSNPYLYPGLVDLSIPSFWIAAASICFNPLFWNVVAQNEYRNHTIQRLMGGNPYYGCYLLAVTIFSLGILRDHLYLTAITEQPLGPFLTRYSPILKVVAGALFVFGNVLVISSMYALGVTGTYLGDYFGILMDEMVTGFPFNLVSDPMYWGSSCSFVATALWYARPSGLILSLLVVIVYAIALRFEGPYTSKIYAKAQREKRQRETISKLQAVDGPATGTRSHASSPAHATRSRARKSGANGK